MSDEGKGGLFKVDRCDIGETGHCALHGVEVERRKSDRRELINLKEEITSLKAHIGKLLQFMDNMRGGMKIGATLALLIMLGSYTYIFNHIQEAEREKGMNHNEMRAAREDRDRTKVEIAQIKSDYARTDERYLAVTGQLTVLNQQMAQLIELWSKKVSTNEELKRYGIKD